MTDRRFTIVERAGYEGERDIISFPRLNDAHSWMEASYTCFEMDSNHPDSLHVAIRQDWTDSDGNEQAEYVY